MRINQAVIFAGGSGVRLRPITDNLPKPLAPVKGVPFLDYLFQSLVEVCIKKILMLVGYKNEMIIRHYGDALPNGIKIEYSIGTDEDQTGRRLLNAYTFLDEYFLLMYGDNFWPIALSDMKKLYEKANVKMLTTAFSNIKGTGEYGFENNLEVGEDLLALNYDKSRKSNRLNTVDIGFFIVQKNALDPTLKGNLSFEEDIFAKFVQNRQVVVYVTDTQYYYITDVYSLKVFEEYVEEHQLKHIGFCAL
ncbi:MAG: sugar phosphate nucleotidyltransferase [Promethearchaeota archaeon]